jgi:hypothetical protein
LDPSVRPSTLKFEPNLLFIFDFALFFLLISGHLSIFRQPWQDRERERERERRVDREKEGERQRETEKERDSER